MSASVLANPNLYADVKEAIQRRLWLDILPDMSFYILSSPLLIMLLGAILALLVGVFKTDPEKPSYPAWTIALTASFASVLGVFLNDYNSLKSFMGSGVLIDNLSSLSFLVISLGTLFTLLASALTAAGRELLRSELLSLLLLCSAGLMLMCAAGEFMSFFIGLEIASISLYVIVGYQRKSIQALEAAMKYFLLGASVAAVMLMGAALIYLQLGSLRWSDFSHLDISSPLALIGVVFLFSGLAFKLAIAPFHAWAPDVYQGAHSHITGYMASMVKFAISIVILRLLSTSLHSANVEAIVWLFSAFAVLSIVVGSLFGLVHNSVKRMLAYSSIANAGYFCLAFVSIAANPTGDASKQALLAYSIIYAILSMSAFTVIAWIEDHNREDLLKEELAGLGKRKPFAAVALTIFLLGLAGIPPLAGFIGKFLLLASAISNGFLGLSILLVVCSAISLYYYLSLVASLWFRPATAQSARAHQDAETNLGMKVLTILGILAVVLIGIFGPQFALNIDLNTAVEQELRIPVQKND